MSAMTRSLALLLALASAWAVDATLVKDLTAGAGSSTPNWVTKVATNDYIISSSAGLHRTNGTPAGTTIVTFPAGVTPVANPPGVSGSSIYALGTSAAAGTELYRIVGTTATLVADINAGAADGIGTGLYGAGTGDKLVFTADAGDGSYAWVTNAGSSPVKLTAAGQNPTAYVDALDANHVLFVTDTGLWKLDLDATVSGSNPSLLSASITGADFAGFNWLTSSVIVTTSTGMWSYHGGSLTSLGTATAGKTLFAIQASASFGTTAYFYDAPATLTTGDVIEIWSTDGTPGGTAKQAATITVPAFNSGFIYGTEYNGQLLITLVDNGDTKTHFYVGSPSSLVLSATVSTTSAQGWALGNSFAARVDNDIKRVTSGGLTALHSLTSITGISMAQDRWFLVAEGTGGQSHVFTTDGASLAEATGDYAADSTLLTDGLVCLFSATTAAAGTEPWIYTAQAGPSHPSCTITPNGVVTGLATVSCTFTFSQDVTGFAIGDITVTNGTKGAFAGSGSVYTLDVTPTANATATIAIAADVANAVSGGLGNLSASASITSDRLAPTFTLTQTPNSTTNANPLVWEITWSEPVTGFVAGGITVSNGTVASLTPVSSTVYTLNVTPTADGVVAISVTAGAVLDAVSNANAAVSNAGTTTYDHTAPTVGISPNSTITASNPVIFTLTFSETPVGLTESDITPTGGTLGTLGGTGLTRTISVTPTGGSPSTVGITLAASAITDAAGNTNAQATASVTYDTSVVSLSVSPNATTSNASPISFGFTFGASVADFTAADVTVTNGVKGAFSGSGTSYSLEVTPSADGAVQVSVAAGAAHDGGSHPSAAASAVVTSDRTAPTVTLTRSAATVAPGGAITVTLTFSESVSAVNAASLTVINGTAGPITGAGTTWHTTITAGSTVGALDVTLAAGAASDAAGNLSTSGTTSATIAAGGGSTSSSSGGGGGGGCGAGAGALGMALGMMLLAFRKP